jgi:hypothetical protein
MRITLVKHGRSGRLLDRFVPIADRRRPIADGRQPTADSRAAFTITELLVAMALCIFLMAVISEAFVAGLTAFRQLKAIGDMDANMRGVTTLLRRDLALPHFEGDSRLGDLTPGSATMGFFQAGEGFETLPNGTQRPAFFEGVDNYASPIVRDTNDWLVFSMRQRGNRPDNMFLGYVPPPVNPANDVPRLDAYGIPGARFDPGPNTYASQWAIAVYFLRPDPQGLTTTNEHDPAAPRLPLFDLHRRQLLLVPEAFSMGTTAPVGTMAGAPILSTTGGAGQPTPAWVLAHVTSDVWSFVTSSAPTLTVQFATPGEVQYPSGMKVVGPGPTYQWDGGRRPRPTITPPAPGPGVVPNVDFVNGPFPSLLQIDPARAGADRVLTDVVSFDVKVWDPLRGAFVDLGFGLPDTTGAWVPTPQTPAVPRPLGRPPVQLLWPAAGPNAPHITQRIYNNAWVYDTWTSRIGGGDVSKPTGWDFHNRLDQQPPYPTGLRAIQITLRLWDRKTSQTRQVTIIQDM